MRHSLEVGFSFGLTSAVITTLGLMIGLGAGTNSKLVVIGGIITIAIADACSDALGIHVSEESENIHSQLEIWDATIATFLSKFLFALTFLVPVLLLDLFAATIVSIIYGLILLGVFSYFLAKKQKQSVLNVVGEHLITAILVIIVTYYVGLGVSIMFG